MNIWLNDPFIEEDSFFTILSRCHRIGSNWFQVFRLQILSNRVKIFHGFRSGSFLKDTLIHEFMMILEKRKSVEDFSTKGRKRIG